MVDHVPVVSLSPAIITLLPLYLRVIGCSSTAGNVVALHKKEVLLTSNPIAMPGGGVIVTLN